VGSEVVFHQYAFAKRYHYEPDGVGWLFFPEDAACCDEWVLWYDGIGGERFIVVRLVSTILSSRHNWTPPEAKKNVDYSRHASTGPRWRLRKKELFISSVIPTSADLDR